MKIKKFFNKKNKYKILAFSSGILLLFTTSFALASCSSVSQSLIDNTISKSNGHSFATDYDLKRISREMLLNDSSQKVVLSAYVNDLVYKWIEKISQLPTEKTYADLLNSQIDTLNKEFDNLSKSSQDTNGVDYPIKFQQDTLDLEGGTRESWIHKRLIEWAKTTFQSKVLEKNFLCVLNNTTASKPEPIRNPSASQILDALKKANNLSFGFSPEAMTSNKDAALDPFFSNFQKFIFNKWVQNENPFIINMSLWKYGTPLKGIESVYNPLTTSTSTGTTTNPGTYENPYFTNSNETNTNTGTLTRFNEFLEGAKAKPNFISDVTTGLIDIPPQYTEDSSTYILGKNTTIYNDLYPEFAAAATYQLFKGKTFADAPNIKVADVDTNLSATVVTSAPIGKDTITSNFVKTTSINNVDISLDPSLVTSIINPDGEFKNLVGQKLFIADSIISKDTSLSNFIFIRNQAGVHAVSIDGYTYIKAATTYSDFTNRAANVVLYRYFMNQTGFGKFSIDIPSELSNFLSKNFDYLIVEYANQVIEEGHPGAIENDMLTIRSAFGLKVENFLSHLAIYLFDVANYPAWENYQNKLYSQKSKYSANYGFLTRDNGFAAPFVYSYIANTTTFDVTTSYNFKNPFSAGGSHELYIATITTTSPDAPSFLDDLKLVPLSSGFEGFQYSQYIYTNNFYINIGLLSFGNDGSSMGDKIKSDILLKYLDKDFDNPTLQINPSIFTSTTVPPSFQTNIGKDINEALANYFFSTVFDGLSQKWIKFVDTAPINSKISSTELFAYFLLLWQESNKITTSAAQSNYLSLYTIVSTAKYLLANDGAELIKYLQNKIALGQDSYLAWYNSQNKVLDPTNRNVSNLLDATLNATSQEFELDKNLNNSFQSSYFGAAPSDTNAITNNTQNFSGIFNSTSNYYKFSGDSFGFAGLQTTSTNSAPTPIKDQIFYTNQIINQTIDKTGLLYSYTSRAKLIETINGYTLISEIDNLANTLYQKITTISIDSVKKAIDLPTKKEALITIVSDTTNVPDNLFLPKNGYISNGKISEKNGTLIQDIESPNIYYGAKTIQLNTRDIESLTSLESALKINSIFTDAQVSNIFYNLVIQIASDSTVQDQAITSIVNSRKVDVYDIRLNNQLGPRWVSNWK